jgi:hypothetical protein
MSWPLSQDYNEAIQSPATNFTDADLKKGETVANALGIPMPCSGNFADVYQMRCPDGSRWAVKCFTREVPGLRERYQEISAWLRRAKLPFTVDFSYLEQGIRVTGKWYPILKMQWVEGLTLNQFVSQHLDKPATLEALAQIWARMGKYLRAAEVGHCDLQHGNVLLVPGPNANALALKLIDYDGMWVPALAKTKPGELGHANYQHPQRLRSGAYSLDVDRFPLLLVATSLHALKANGEALWRKYDNADNLLFKESDLRKPVKSPLIYELTKTNDPFVQPLLDHLLKALKNGLEATPLLEEVMPMTQSAVTTSSRPSRLITTAPAPVAPPVASFLPIAPVVSATAPVVATGGWDFVKSASDTTHLTRRRGGQPSARAKMVWIGAVAAPLVFLGLLSAFAFWTMSGPKPKTPSGPPAARVEPTPPKPIEGEAVLVLDIDQPGAEVSVDGEKQEAKTTGDVKPITIRAKPGPHTITINKEGFKTRAADVELVLDRPRSLTMRLTPLDGPEPISTRFPILPGGTGTVRVEDDTLVLDDLDHIPACANIYFGDTKWADYDFQVDAKRLAGSTHCALWFRHEDPGNQLCYSFGKGSHLVTLENLVDARWRRGIQQEAGPIGNDDWYTLLVSVRGAEVRCFVDGRQKFMETRQDHLRGSVGFHANGSRFAFRNIKVTAADGKVLLEGLPALTTIKDNEKPSLPPSPTTEGFTPLFNGKDLTGWKPEGKWKVGSDGALVGEGPDAAIVTTRDDCKDFTIRIKLSASADAEAFVAARLERGPDGAWQGMSTRVFGDGSVVNAGKADSTFVQNERGIKRLKFKPGELFALEARVTGDVLEINTNGEFTAGCHCLSPSVGRIGLFVTKGTLRVTKFEIKASDAVPPSPTEPPPTPAEDDPIRAKLDKAKNDFNAAVEKYQQKVHDGLDKAEETARTAGNNALVDEIKAEREAFDGSGDLPKKAPAREYKGDIDAARATLASAYDAAVKAYTKEKMYAKAETVAEERKAFEQGHPTDAFRVGSVWKGGTVQVWIGHPEKGFGGFTLTVLERDDKTFKAMVENRGSTHTVSGTVKGRVIRWLTKDVIAIKGPPGHDFMGKISGNVVELQSEWVGQYVKAPKPAVPNLTVLTVLLRLEKK